MAKDTENITAVESEIETWLKQYFQEEPGRDFKTTLTRLKQQLQNRRVGTLIDNLEPALDKQGRLLEKHSLYVELLRVLANENVQSLTLITSRERLCDERVNGIYHYPLAVLTVEAWKEFFRTRKIKIDTPSLEAMHQIYGGNAKAMDILFGVMREDYDGDMSAYWLENSTCVETELKNLVESQFNRLQTLDKEAYKLLCRLGCFRYQDVSRVSIDALLALLWDVPEEKQRDVIKDLRNLRLVEFEKGEYWLHPVIRKQGIERLKASGGWEEVNRKAAEFWTERVKTITNVDEAYRAFEAYHHYLNIEDYDRAGDVIAKERNNGIEKNAPLGVNFYNFGLLEKIKISISIIINKIQVSYTLARLYNIFGDLYWMSGELYNAIETHEKCREIVEKIQQSNHNYQINYIHKINYFNVVSLFNIGLCYIDLCDFEKAIEYFKNTISLCKELKYRERLVENSIFILAFLNSQMSFYEEALKYFNQCNFEFILYEESLWGKGYSYIFYALTCKNIEKTNDCFESYQQAINFAEEVNYPQVKGKALTGLAELYRIQNDFEKALSHHSESIELLDKIGAKCDLAEAYYQLGLTYQKMGETENSNTNFNKAIQLYQEMEAPKQVEKVETAKSQN
ncbi:tetratricopeptide repeat protein [Sphaerospermopsis aphanizomenoides BCCUSP55]|uniref:tetratricopeptide repeat protein n=1 Tax=Sphaerospermopsis aphanizomenoides TaxID=459663 RepID=UPI00190719C5|nr:tetratricopeptide repeat protein [Sphaerospermopsis aphanizomenoides]MBK1986087.1 tetratricopeptide repeat protein [Sphaerospermopsis aphanizomenoides BCCUSP55]